MKSIVGPHIEVAITTERSAAYLRHQTEIYFHEGRYFIEARDGEEFSIVVYPRTSGRLEILESVDGRDVLRDAPATFQNKGMVINHIWINDGWLISDKEIARFVFGSPRGSVADQATGSASNVGVIGVAVFQERRYIPDYRIESFPRSFVGDSSFSSKSFAASADMGAHMGKSEAVDIGHTSFERDTVLPVWSCEIQYRSERWLGEHGVFQVSSRDTFPKGFSDSTNPTGYEKFRRG